MPKTARSPESEPSWRAGLSRQLFAPIDVAGLAFLRISCGALLFWECRRFFRHGWIDENYVAPRFHFSYYGFSWLRPWPEMGMYLHFVALGVAAVLVMLGWKYRSAAVLFFLGFTYVFLLERTEYLNHFYLICLLSFLLTWLPVDRAFSLDAYRHPQMRSDFVPAWALWTVRGQIAIPYFYGGLAKLNGDWLHGQPMQIWMSRMDHVRAVVPAFGEPWLAYVFSYCGLLLDLLVVPLLLWRKTRAVAFGAAVLFHVLNAIMFRIGIFPWLMICATTVFLSPDWPRRLFRLRPAAAPPQAGTPVPARPNDRRLVGFLAIFFFVQLLIPFRYFLYPGVPEWTEQGAAFSWRMMLSDKSAAVGFRVVEPKNGRAIHVELSSYLTARQVDKMGLNPEMLRQFAGFLKAELARQGVPDVSVYVTALSSLNGRKPQLLVDPTVDLAAQPCALFPYPWIVPLVEPLPAKPWTVPQAEWLHYVDVTHVPQRR